MASLKQRFLANVIDLSIFIALFVAGYLVINFRHEMFRGQSGAGFFYAIVIPDSFISMYLIVFISWTTFIVLTELRSGQSIGKRCTKIKVLTKDLKPPSPGITLTRHLFDTVDLLLFIGLFVASMNRQKQRIGDLIAKTVVVRI